MFPKMPATNSAKILLDTQNLINTNMKMLELAAHPESERLLTRRKLCELQKHLENIETRLGKIQI